jgi:hypothetical protein
MQVTVTQLGIEELNTAIQLHNNGNNTYEFFSLEKIDAIEVYNALGQQMNAVTLTNNTLDLSLVAKGVYYIRFTSFSGQTSLKILVE